MKNKFQIEIVYANPQRQELLIFAVSPTTTIGEAISQSGILDLFPEIDLTNITVGIFGKIRALNDVILDGERIEIYRPLIIDPKDARRKRAKKGV